LVIENRRVQMQKAGKIFFAPAYIAGVVLLLNLFFSTWVYDDPFITYRYAENLRRGLGFVYNADERVLSTTTPLFTILLALSGNIYSGLPRLAGLLGMTALAAGGLFLWDLARTWNAPMAGWGALLLYPGFPLLVSTLGSETPLYLAFCLGAFAFYAHRHYPLTAVFAALSVLTRPDGILIGLTLAIHHFVQDRRRISWMSLAVFLGLTLPWFIFAWIYFGSPLPVTLAAKQQQGAMEISRKFISGLPGIFMFYDWRPYLLTAGLALAGLFFTFRRAGSWALLLCWTVLYFLVYSLLGVSGYFWYYAPLVPGLIALAGLGVSSMLKNALRSFHFITLSMIFIALVASQVYQLRQLSKHQYRNLKMNNLMGLYRVAGRWLEEHTPPQATVGTLEVGIIGYYCQRPMVDFTGLIQPEVGKKLTRYGTYEDSAIWAVEHYRPDYLVLFEDQFPRLEQDYAARHCEAVQTFLGNSLEHPINLIVYSCR